MKTALITGGSRGIGRECVKAFTAQGYRVAFIYRSSRTEADELAKSCGAIPIRCDITVKSDVDAAGKEIKAQLNHVDVLVNNAGIAQQKLFTDIHLEEWQRMINTHLLGAYMMSQIVLPGMISRKYGRIINIGSIWGQVGASCEVHYSAAKAGLIGLTKALAKEVAPSGITVNCVCPGVILTDMMKDFTREELAQLAQETPVGRLGTPADVAQGVLFFADEKSTFITGQVLGINGGFGE